MSCLDFAPDQKTVMESLSRPANRSFLEALLKEMSGDDWTAETQPRGRIAVDPPPERNAAPSEPQTWPNDSLESFKDDPLIQEALEIFKGEIKSVTT